MIDFHAHILPGIDDGSKNVEMSLEMLTDAYENGTEVVVSTSHIYTEDESDIDAFIEKRAAALARLEDGVRKSGKKIPGLRLGAEVYMKPHVGNYDSVRRLAISGTDYILLEMPYSGWSNELYEAVYNVQTLGLKPIMAHIERFLQFRKEFEQLKSLDVIFQVNSESFLHRPMRKELLKLFDEGYVQLLGSDMHNTSSRPNTMPEALEIIEKHFGAGFVKILEKNAQLALDNKDVSHRKYPKLGFFDRLKL